MEFKVEGYQYNLECVFQNNQVIAKGHIWREQQPTSLRFPIGAVVEVEFNRKKIKAKIEKFTKNNQVVVEVSPTQKKKVDLQTFISQNRFTEICYRIENEKGEGPYRSENPSPGLQAWKDIKRNQYEQERNYDQNHLHPAIDFDLHLKRYPMITAYNGLFGFRNLEQLNKWFMPEDLQLLESEGFKVVIKQKGLDYFNSFYSSTQMVIVKSEEDYNKILNAERSFYY